MRQARNACNSVKTWPFCVKLHEATGGSVCDVSSKLGADRCVRSCNKSDSSVLEGCRGPRKRSDQQQTWVGNLQTNGRGCSTNQVPCLPRHKSQNLQNLLRKENGLQRGEIEFDFCANARVRLSTCKERTVEVRAQGS